MTKKRALTDLNLLHGSSTEPSPLISVITVCRDAEKTIEATLRSVAEQVNVGDLAEHIVVDGASEDDTLKIVKRFPTVRWMSEPDEGISDAFNKGLRLANGEYVMYLNADDYLHDQTVLHDVLNFINNHQKPDWIVGDIAAKVKDEIATSTRRYPPSCWSLIFRCRIGHPTVFLKRATLLEIGGFDTSFKLAMDYDLWHRLCARGYKPSYFPRIISVFSREGLTSIASPTLIQETHDVAQRFRNNPLKRLIGKTFDQFGAGN